MGTKIFKDLLVYRLTQPVAMFHHANLDELNELLETKKAREPGSQELGTFGFMEPAHEEDCYVERLGDGAILITAQAWKRDLPASVVNRELAIKVRNIEEDENRKIYGKERRQLKDEVIMRLLPRAFVKGKRVSALIQWPYVYIDTASAKLAENLLSLLREVLGSLPVRPVALKVSPIVSMTEWLRQGTTSADTDAFVLGESFKANAANEEASTLSGKRVDLSEDDIRGLLDCGRQVTQLELGFKDEENLETVYFTLTEDLSIKGIQWPDVLAEKANQDAGEEAEAITLYRATLLLISDALGRLFEGVVDALGGEDVAQPTEDFDARLTKAAKAVAKDTKSFQLGDTNLATDFPLAALDQADEEDEEPEFDDITASLYDRAVRFVRTRGCVSISAVQRKFKIGYNRAAGIMEQLEENGVVTGIDSSGSREVISATDDVIKRTLERAKELRDYAAAGDDNEDLI